MSESVVGINALLQRHTKALEGNQHNIEVIAGELGIPLQGVDPQAVPEEG